MFSKFVLLSVFFHVTLFNLLHIIIHLNISKKSNRAIIYKNLH